ncbi:MAG TPA: tyrosine-type recombinase/integrase [Pseudonocardiaceae bacterium]|nr:tyrosine-type recombinase/integrase [Pseudonocardiaceae bacterium]
MTALAPTLQAFFTDRLVAQKNASGHTVASYRDTLRLLLVFTAERTGTQPARMQVEDLQAPLIGAFLNHLEHERGNSVRSRNTRLAAIHSLFRYAALRLPDHADLIARVLAIPPKRCDHAVVSFLDKREIEALLDAPDTSRWIGRRDRALLMLTVQTGLRVSELTGLRCRDVHLGHGAHVRCLGKGRKQRCTPLTSQTVAVLQAWLRERQGQPNDPLFPTSHGRTLSCDAVAWLLSKHAATAQQRCPSIGTKTITPHVLRHSCAMTLLRAGVDTSVIALWLGHEKTDTVQIYVHADLALKERALARTTPLGAKPGRYRPPDALLTFLEGL